MFNVGSRVADLSRLYELIAEDRAIEDTMYVLATALDQELIGLDLFIKVSGLCVSNTTLTIDNPKPCAGAIHEKGACKEDIRSFNFVNYR